MSLDYSRRKQSVTGIVLAGGKSRRMGGHNKALLKIGDRCIVESVCDILSSVLTQVILITNTPDEFRFLNLPMYTDIVPDRGSLGGLYTGLLRCSGCFGFLVGCDMPFLNERVIAYMLGKVPGYDVVIPRINAHVEPLHAIYSKRCLPHLEKLINDRDLSIINLFKKIKLLEVQAKELEALDPGLKFAINVNTPEDLEKARHLVRVV